MPGSLLAPPLAPPLDPVPSAGATALMHAVAFDAYGGPEVLRPVRLPRPAVGPRDVLIRVAAAGVNPADARIRSGQFRFLMRTRFPFVPGADVAGVVEAAGHRVTHVRPGDAVYAMLPIARSGACAELVAVPGDLVAPAPRRITLGDAAAVPLAALTALQALRDGLRLRAGQRLVVNGAGGGVGSFAVQIAHALGAAVVAVCSTAKLSVVRELAPAEVVPYDTGAPLAIGAPVDAILDAAGARPYGEWAPFLAPRGAFATVAPTPAMLTMGRLAALSRGHRLWAGFVTPDAYDLARITRWIDDGAVSPVIAHCYPLDAVAVAHRDVEHGRTAGKRVVIVDPALAAQRGGAANGALAE